MKRFIYLISPNKIDEKFYLTLKKVLACKRVGYFQLRLKKYKKNKIQYLFNGDDYQILFTASKRYRSIISSMAKKMNQKITLIGKINKGYKKNSIKFNNRAQNLSKFKGYSHKF